MIAREEWERRFKDRIVARCMEPLSEEDWQAALAHDPEFEPWTVETATRAAAAEFETLEFEASEFEELCQGFEDDPEGAADECLAAWEG